MAPLQALKCGMLIGLLTGGAAVARVSDAPGFMSEIGDVLLPPLFASPYEPPAGMKIHPPMLGVGRPVTAASPERSLDARDNLASPTSLVLDLPGDDQLARSPKAFAAVPDGPPPGLVRTPSIAEQGFSALHMKEDWQKLGFMAGVLLLGGAGFWRLGLRARSSPSKPAYSQVERVDDFGEVAVPRVARYETLREAIEAMKAQAARR